MAEDYVTTHSVQGGRFVAGYKGSRAGESFDSTEAQKKKKEDEEWATFAHSKGIDPLSLSGLGGATKRGRLRPQFDSWRKTRTGNIGTLLK